MAYEIVVIGLAERTLNVALEDLPGDVTGTDDTAAVTVRLPDQSALVGAINKIHSLGIRIEHVTRTP